MTSQNLNSRMKRFVNAWENFSREKREYSQFYNKTYLPKARYHERLPRPLTAEQNKLLKYYGTTIIRNKGNALVRKATAMRNAYNQIQNILPENLKGQRAGANLIGHRVYNHVRNVQEFRQRRRIPMAMKVIANRKKRRAQSVVTSSYTGFVRGSPGRSPIPGSLARLITEMGRRN